MGTAIGTVAKQIVMNETRLARFVPLLMMLLWTVAACDNRREAPPPPAPESFPSLPNATTVDLLFDSTLSMQGFTQTGASQTSYYQQIIQELSTAATSSWNTSPVTLARFGDAIAPVTSTHEITQPRFYADKRYSKRTYIERVIARSNPKHVTVIVTDLFQNNADVSVLIQALKDKYFQQGLAVGVVGIRSQYDGIVYDVGLDARRYRYKSNAQVSSFRPFYLLVLGSHANVQQYISVIFKRPTVAQFPAKQAVIFSKFVTGQPVPFRAAELLTGNRISESDLSSYLPAGYSEQHVKAFLARRSSGEVSFSTRWNYVQLPWTQPHDDQLRTEVMGWRSEPSGERHLKLIPSDEVTGVLLAQSHLTRPENSNRGTIELTSKMSVGRLSPGLYRYRIVIRSTQHRLPQWVSEWTLPEKSIAGLPSNAPNFDGSKTYNLATFLDGLSGAVRSISLPDIADIYCYINVD